jgi:hypothetical protein
MRDSREIRQFHYVRLAITLLHHYVISVTTLLKSVLNCAVEVISSVESPLLHNPTRHLRP